MMELGLDWKYALYMDERRSKYRPELITVTIYSSMQKFLQFVRALILYALLIYVKGVGSNLKTVIGMHQGGPQRRAI